MNGQGRHYRSGAYPWRVAKPRRSRSTCRRSDRSGCTRTESGSRSMRASRRTKSGCSTRRRTRQRPGNLSASQSRLPTSRIMRRTPCLALLIVWVAVASALGSGTGRGPTPRGLDEVLLHPGRQPADVRQDRARPAAVLRPAPVCRWPRLVRIVPPSGTRLQRRRLPINRCPWPTRHAQRASADQSGVWKGVLLGRPHHEARGAGVAAIPAFRRNGPDAGRAGRAASRRRRLSRPVPANVWRPAHSRRRRPRLGQLRAGPAHRRHAIRPVSGQRRQFSGRSRPGAGSSCSADAATAPPAICRRRSPTKRSTIPACRGVPAISDGSV